LLYRYITRSNLVPLVGLAYVTCASLASAQSLFWGGGSTDITGPQSPAYGDGSWDTVLQNWASDPTGTTYQAWNNTGSGIAELQWVASNYALVVEEDITVGGVTVTQSATPTGQTVSFHQGAAAGREKLIFADGAVINVDGANDSFVLNFTGGTNEVDYDFLGDVTKQGAGLIQSTVFHQTFTIASGHTFDIQQGGFTISGNRSMVMNGATLNLESGTTFTDNIGVSSFAPQKTIGALTGSGTYASQSVAEPKSTLQIGSGNLSSTFDGTIEDSNANPLRITKVGTGTFELAGTGTYGGLTVLQDGTYVLSGDYTGEGFLDIANGDFDLSGNGKYGDLTFSGTGVATLFGIGTLDILQANYSLADASNDIGLGNLLGDGGQGLQVTTFNDGSADFTRITLIPEPTTASLAMAGLLSLLARRRRS